jgi:hypothetical protein
MPKQIELTDEQILADLKGFEGIAEEVGDLSRKRKRREDNDEAMGMLEKLAGIK